MALASWGTLSHVMTCRTPAYIRRHSASVSDSACTAMHAGGGRPAARRAAVAANSVSLKLLVCASRRGRQYPAAAHTVAVFASLRLREAARPGDGAAKLATRLRLFAQTLAASQLRSSLRSPAPRPSRFAATEIASAGYRPPRREECWYSNGGVPTVLAAHPHADLQARSSSEQTPSRRSGPCRLDFIQQRDEGTQLHGLGEMSVEAGRCRAPPIIAAAVAGHCDGVDVLEARQHA
jgi:hypothetical protein